MQLPLNYKQDFSHADRKKVIQVSAENMMFICIITFGQINHKNHIKPNTKY